MRILRVIEALCTLVYIQVSIKAIGLTRLITTLERRYSSRPRRTSPSRSEIDDLVAIYYAAARLYPMHLECLARSLTVYVMARRRGLEMTFTLGVRMTPFLSHAWLRSSDFVFREDSKIIATLTPIVVMN